MTELSKFIGELVEYREKVESHLNKKYKPFVRKIINWDSLGKSVNPNKIKLTKELIVFKLGLEAKSHKAIEISLFYLLKMFENKFVDLNQPNYCQCFAISEGGVDEIIKDSKELKAKQQVRHLLIGLMRHCLNYKKTEIYELIIKVLQNLITQPILDLILDSLSDNPPPSASRLLFNFFSFRFHIYEQICCYTESEMKSFSTLTFPSEKFQKQIKRAYDEHQQLESLIGKYMTEYLSIVDGQGGRYGLCIICGQPAEHYCKATRAALCSMDCKKKHIQLAQTQYKHHFQSTHLWESIYVCFRNLFIFLEDNQNIAAFGVLTSLLEKPYLFMVVKSQFRALISRHTPNILSKLFKSKSEVSFENIFTFVSSITKYWMFECVSTIQFFFKEYIIKVLQDKKPSYRFLTFVFKTLAKIFEKGKVIVQLYVNFDCELNKDNILQKVLFELAKIVQDRFAQVQLYSKQQKQNIKNHCLSLFIIMSIGLNDYRKQELKSAETTELIHLKQKKLSIEQFVVRFNEHWTSGLKTLFNLNLVGLDSDKQIVEIILNIKGLRKEVIDQYLSCEKGQELFDIFIQILFVRNKNILFLVLIDLYHYIPLKTSSICVKKCIQEHEKCSEQKRQKQAEVYVQFLCSAYNLIDLKNFLSKRSEFEVIPHQVESIYMKAIDTRHPLTTGNQKTYFTYCCSKDYLEVLSNQLTLLQIPISYLLENDYEIDRLLSLTEQLIQICPHSNWMSLLIKNTSLNVYPSPQFDELKMKIVLGIINIMEKQASFIENWTLIATFLSQLNMIFKMIESKRINEGKIAISQRLNMGIVERSLMEAGSKCDKYFGQFLYATLSVARDQIDRDSIFMTQKFFQVIDANPKKFLLVVDDILPFLTSFTKNLEKASNDVCYKIADMLKHSFAKLLKMPKPNDKWINESQAQFWILFQNIALNKGKEVTDFSVDCIVLTIYHYYNIGYKSWIFIFSFMKGNVKKYREKVHMVVDKITKEKMRNCQDFYPDLVDICLQLVDQEQTKISIESLHCLRNVLEMTNQIKVSSKEQAIEEQSGYRQLRNIYIRVGEYLINKIFYSCHEDILDIFFKLLKTKVHGQFLLLSDQVDQLIECLFMKTEQYTLETLQISQKTLNVALNWSVSNKYSKIISFFENLIIDKYNALSLSAIKCIKTYIQMLNPKQRQEWLHIEDCLLSISKNTHISDELDLNMPDKYQKYQNEIVFEDRQLHVNLNMFTNKMVVQKSIVQMLPNHIQCLQQVSLLYDDIFKFNDNVYLRCLLWRRGLGKEDRSHPPNLLALEESIGGKLVAIYNSAKEEYIIDFSLNIFSKYCDTSSQLLKISEFLSNPEKSQFQNENATITRDYHLARKVPLTKVMGYFLPKYTRYCRNNVQRKKIVLKLTECLQYVQNRDQFLKCIKELTKV